MYNLFLYQSKDSYIYSLFLNILKKDKTNIRMYGVFSDVVGDIQKDLPVFHKYYYRHLFSNKLLLISKGEFDSIKQFHKFSNMAIISDSLVDSANHYENYFLKSSIDQNTEEITNVAKLLFNE
jgi:hypothetical protein